jgi:hypothetical protein
MTALQTKVVVGYVNAFWKSRSIQFRRGAWEFQPNLELDAQVADLMISILEICTNHSKN